MKKIRELVLTCENALVEGRDQADMTMRGVQLLCGLMAESLAPGPQRKRLDEYTEVVSA